jgi:hypothetical protein
MSDVLIKYRSVVATRAAQTTFQPENIEAFVLRLKDLFHQQKKHPTAEQQSGANLAPAGAPSEVWLTAQR